MKKLLITTLAAIGIGFSAASLADHDRGRFHDGYRHHDNHRVVVRKHHYGKKHWKRHYRSYDRHHYRPGYYRHDRVIIRERSDDDFYKWMGGIYLLNEVLHHDYH